MLYAAATFALASVSATLVAAQWLRACADFYVQSFDDASDQPGDRDSTVVAFRGASHAAAQYPFRRD
jgi:hypothetical protein